MGKKRKTKEQKIIADLRRKLSLRQAQDKTLQASPSGQALQQAPAFTTVSAGKQGKSLKQAPPSPETTFSPNFPPARKEMIQIPVSTPEKSASNYAQKDYSYLAKDLKRVFILTGLAISLQGVLYLALR